MRWQRAGKHGRLFPAIAIGSAPNPSNPQGLPLWPNRYKAAANVRPPREGRPLLFPPVETSHGQCQSDPADAARDRRLRSEEHKSELQSLMRISYAVFCLKKKKTTAHTRQQI